MAIWGNRKEATALYHKPDSKRDHRADMVFTGVWEVKPNLPLEPYCPADRQDVWRRGFSECYREDRAGRKQGLRLSVPQKLAYRAFGTPRR